jgi:sugar lactone lactonase YvrE
MMLFRVMDGYFRRRQARFSFSVVVVILTASSAFGQTAPPVVVDAQQTIGTNFNVPKSVAVAPNGTVYVADTSNNQVVKVTTNLPGASTQTQVNTGTLFAPAAVAVDANGDLFIGDYPNIFGFGVPRVIEVVAQNGVLTNTVNTIYFQFNEFLSRPTALAVDNHGQVYLALGAPDTGIYNVTTGNATKLTVNGVTGTPTITAMVRNSGTSLYFVNSSSVNGGVYVVPDTGGNAQAVATTGFAPANPSGLALDSAGDLFVLSQLAVSGSTSWQVIDVPANSAVTLPYIIPSTGLVGADGIALDPNGNVDVLQVGTNGNGTGLVSQLDYLNEINMGSATVASAGTAILFNIEFNDPATLAGFQTVTLGDMATKNDVVTTGTGTCLSGATGPVSASDPYICDQPFETVPQYTGSRVSAIQVLGPRPTPTSAPVVLDSSPVYETGLSGAEITYPLDETVTATPLSAPQGLAISGFNQKVYIADFGGGTVYSTSGLTGTGLTPVSTGSIALQAPSAVALNGEGDLYIADFDLGEVIVVPTTTGKAPSVVNTGSPNLLQHPISLTVDYLGNLYIGDAGIDGDTASSSNPGYVVKVPHNGVATKLTIPFTPTIIFPQALATDPTNGNLYIGDGGDGVSVTGQVVKVPATGNASLVTFPTQTAPINPTGLAVDAAENLYVLDGSANTGETDKTTGTITVVPLTGNSYQVGFVNTSLSAPSALASSAGTQSFVVANIGNGTANSLVYLNGNSSTLQFNNVKTGTTSPSLTATVRNIGNQSLKLSNPYDTFTGLPFAISSTTCKNNLTIAITSSCAINVQFKPIALQPYSGTITIHSNAYNNGTPVINLMGTGSTTSSIALPDAAQPATGLGRKSFHR